MKMKEAEGVITMIEMAVNAVTVAEEETAAEDVVRLLHPAGNEARSNKRKVLIIIKELLNPA